MKKTNIIKKVLLLGFTSVLFSLRSQDVHFSQYYNFPLFANPANTGDIKGSMRAVTNYRSQWSSVAIPYTTYGASLEGVLHKNRYRTRTLSAGLMVIGDKVGEYELKTDIIMFTLAGAVKPNARNLISVGLQGGFGQKKFDPAALRWGNQYNGLYYDANLSSGEQYYFNNVFYRDISSGINWGYDANSIRDGIYSRSSKKTRANLGLAVFHINRPNTTMNDPYQQERLYRKLTLNGSVMVHSKHADLSITPSFLFEWQGPSTKTNIGFMTRYLLKQGTVYTGLTDGKAFSMGAFYRYKDAVVVATLFEYHQLAFGISYDVNVSKFVVATASRGGVEFSLRWMSPQQYWFTARGKNRKLRAKF